MRPSPRPNLNADACNGARPVESVAEIWELVQPVLPKMGGGNLVLPNCCGKRIILSMIENTIGDIEAKIHCRNDERRAKSELLQSRTLKSRRQMAKTYDEQASSIANFTQTSAHEATREKLNPER